jgi:hypothetical protein
MVARKLLEVGATNLQAKLGAHVASFGDQCWQTDTTIQGVLRRWDGRSYHRESIGRARRLMARRGWIGSKRIFPQQTPIGAKYPSTHGTTSKHIQWKNIALRNPLTKRERKERKQVARTLDAAERLTPRRRHAHIPIDPGMAAMVEGIGAKSSSGEKIIVQRSQRPAHRSRERQADAEANAADQRARFEAWRRDNEKKPP